MAKPEIKKIEITKSILNKGKSINGGWGRNQLKVLGEDFSKGWKKRLIGKTISKEQYNDFIKLKDSHFKRSLEEITEMRKKRKEARRKKNKVKLLSTNKILTYQEQYEHPNWQRVRLEVLSRDQFTCKYCGNEHEQLHVHHLRYQGKFIWNTPVKYLVTLCKTCHKKQHKHMK